MKAMQAEADDSDRERLAMLDNVIEKHILVPPKFGEYPKVESILWRTVQQAIVGKISVDDALTSIRKKIEHIVAVGDGTFAKPNGKSTVAVKLPVSRI